jgi:phospholipase C
MTFPTAAEVLFNAGYSVKAYFSGATSGFNMFSWFRNFQTKGLLPTALYNSAMTGNTLFGDGTPGGIGDPTNPTPASVSTLAFEEDCANGVLPDVSWLWMPGAADEHPPAIPAAGAQYLASKLEALAANKKLWNSTVFILNYDENDGFFDHVPPPIPDPKRYPEEYVHVASPKGTPGGGLPVGGGFRVPCIIVSPWTVGGQVYSEISDHTSCLRFLEPVTAAGGLSRHGRVTFTPISNWRRKTFGDFTGALRPGAPKPAPSSPQFTAGTTAANLAAQTSAALQPMPPRPGATQHMPQQLKR